MTVGALIQQPVVVTREPATAHFDRLRAYAKVLREEGLDSVQLNDFIQLAKAEAKGGPREPLAQLLDELLADQRLHDLVIDGHARVRSMLLEVQQELGFPWALQIAPEDLPLLAPPNDHYGFRTVTFFVAVCSAAFNGLYATSLLREPPFGLFFMVGALHALITAFAAFSFNSKKLLRVLGWMWLCGPAFSLGTMLAGSGNDRPLFVLLGLVFAFPAMLTAWLALGLSGKAPE